MKPGGGIEGTGGTAVKLAGTNSFDDTDRPLLLPNEETVLSSSLIALKVFEVIGKD